MWQIHRIWQLYALDYNLHWRAWHGQAGLHDNYARKSSSCPFFWSSVPCSAAQKRYSKAVRLAAWKICPPQAIASTCSQDIRCSRGWFWSFSSWKGPCWPNDHPVPSQDNIRSHGKETQETGIDYDGIQCDIFSILPFPWTVELTWWFRREMDTFELIIQPAAA